GSCRGYGAWWVSVAALARGEVDPIVLRLYGNRIAVGIDVRAIAAFRRELERQGRNACGSAARLGEGPAGELSVGVEVGDCTNDESIGFVIHTPLRPVLEVDLSFRLEAQFPPMGIRPIPCMSRRVIVCRWIRIAGADEPIHDAVVGDLGRAD